MENPNIRKHRRNEEKDDNLPLRNILNIIFILMTIATIVLFFVLPEDIRKPYYLTTGFVAVFVKMAETGIRSNVIKIKKK